MHPAALGGPALGDRPARADRHRRDGRLLSRHDLPVVEAGAPAREATGALVLVHGRDQDPAFMLEVAERIGRPDLAWLLPAASGGTWYPGRYRDPRAANEPWVTGALAAIGRATSVAEANGIGVERIALVGFSQGACLALELLARDPRPFAAVAVLTGARIGSPEELAAAPAPDLAGLRVHCSSSRTDDWIPPQDVTAAAQWLRDGGADVTQDLSDEPEHRVSAAEAAAVAALLPARR